jgi:UDP-N-acetylglucosamine--N-acetylmuramyl-(pentapeptide) pyrophosphoryl-undecaprenol N-acetylglucosamine transferase
MKIVFTGGGTGGHFYPIVAIIEELHTIVEKENLIRPKMYYMAPDPYNKKTLFDNDVEFVKVPAGKRRRYTSLSNFADLFRTAYGVIVAVFKMFSIFPDMVFSKGGYVSFPVVFAARLLRIPVFIHESDSVPGRANLWAGKFASKVAVSYAEAAEYFPKGKVAHTGNPIRRELIRPIHEGSHEHLKTEEGIPIILILGGSQGSQIINEVMLDILPNILNRYQVIHQAGGNNFQEVKDIASVALLGNDFASRYKPMAFLDEMTLKMAAGVADIIISRAGSTIFEIASWGVPGIIIPISDSNGDHQRKNAFIYARTGAAMVIEEGNLTPNVLTSEIDRLMANKEALEDMRKKTERFRYPDAAHKIAEEIIEMAIDHE